METIHSLQNHFLIAMPALLDFNFVQSVIYICAHNEEGSMGVVINRPIVDISLGAVLAQMEISVKDEQVKDIPVFLGGPVQNERGFIIHRPSQFWQSTLVTSNELALTSSQDILQAMAEGTGPTDALVILGYSGWGVGQLEKEIANNYWLTVPAEPKILFNTPCEMRWQAALNMLGVDGSSLSAESGHA